MKRIDWGLFSGLLRRFQDLHFAGSRLRMLWSVLTPLLLVGVVAWVFLDFFNVRQRPVFSILAGLIFWQWFSGTLSQGHRLFLDQRQFFKALQTPRNYFIPAFVAFRALLALPGVALIVLGAWSLFGPSVVRFACLDGVMLTLLVVFWVWLLLGLSFLLSTWTVFWPDLSHGLDSALSLLLWLSPVFYSGNQVPVDFRWMLWANPLAWFLEGLRACLNLPHLLPVCIGVPLFGLFSGWMLLFGFFYFRKHQKELLSLI